MGWEGVWLGMEVGRAGCGIEEGRSRVGGESGHGFEVLCNVC